MKNIMVTIFLAGLVVAATLNPAFGRGKGGGGGMGPGGGQNQYRYSERENYADKAGLRVQDMERQRDRERLLDPEADKDSAKMKYMQKSKRIRQGRE